jgi:hypothetical protein
VVGVASGFESQCAFVEHGSGGIGVNQQGFLLTIGDGQERSGVRDAFNWLRAVADELQVVGGFAHSYSYM